MKQVFLKWIFWFLLTFHPPLQGQAYYENQEAARLLLGLRSEVEAMIAAFPEGAAAGGLDPLKQRLTLLEQSLRRDAANRLDLSGSATLEAAARNELLFNGRPSLPPEDKKGGSWSFGTSRFEVIPDHLYIFAVKLKGSRTIRLKSVTLFFRNGEKIVHDSWKDLQQGNGQDFSKRVFTPYLAVYDDRQTRRARALKSIEILGSAQDGEFSAELEFVFLIPDPQDIPIKPMLDLIAQIRQSWDSRNVDLNRLNQNLTDLVRLGEIMKTKLPMGGNTVD